LKKKEKAQPGQEKLNLNPIGGSMARRRGVTICQASSSPKREKHDQRNKLPKLSTEACKHTVGASNGLNPTKAKKSGQGEAEEEIVKISPNSTAVGRKETTQRHRERGST